MSCDIFIINNHRLIFEFGLFNKISEIIFFSLVHIVEHLAFLYEDQYLVTFSTISHC